VIGVQVVLDHPNACVPARKYHGDAGADLVTSEEVTIPPGSFRDIPTGIRLGLPPGYWVRIAGRSSTLRRRGLLVAEGIIDNGYVGPIYAGIWNLNEEPVTIRVGERVAQMVLHRIADAKYFEVDSVESADGRGHNGFGSTGA
jgi:dUTP pyrophosphatase